MMRAFWTYSEGPAQVLGVKNSLALWTLGPDIIR